MKLVKGTRIALKALFSHKLRTALAMTGIVVGVCSVIVMVAVGDGAQKQVLSKIRAMGTDLVMVTAGQVKVIAGRQRQTGNVSTLTMRDFKAITDEAQNIKAAAPAQGKKMLVKYEVFNTTTSIIGTTEAIIPVRDLSTLMGDSLATTKTRPPESCGNRRNRGKKPFENRNPVGEVSASESLSRLSGSRQKGLISLELTG
jgi:putative ABC transport system permease protein